MSRCILCKDNISIKTKPEHILLNALGGRKTVSDVLCPTCNHEMGISPDNDLADSTKYIRNMCNMKCGDGDPAPQIRGHKGSDDLKLNLKAGMQIDAHAKEALKVTINEDGIQVEINAFSEEEADKLCEGAARKIAKHFGKEHPDVIKAIKEDIKKDQKSHYAPAPKIHTGVQFGQGEAVRSKAKACLVFLASLVGNEHVLKTDYDRVRSYINGNSSKELNASDFVMLDTRLLPDTISEIYGSHPNIISVGSDGSGKVYGYFRLYGAIGWRLLLSSSDKGLTKVASLISNPFNTKEWNVLEDDNAPLSYGWINQNLEVNDICFQNVKIKLGELIRYGGDISRDIWLSTLVNEGLINSGCEVGDIISEEHIKLLAHHLATPLVAAMTNKVVPKY